MTLEYDRDADALAITLAAGIVARTEEIDAGTLVDLDERGNVLAIEVIRPERPWPIDEIAARFGLSDEEVDVLKGLRRGDGTLEFSEPAPLAVA